MSMRAALMCACVAGVAGYGETVRELEVGQYLGRWYQVYSSLPTRAFSSQFCVTANYGANSDGTVSVLNQDRLDSVTGERRSITGFAEVKDAAQPGLLTVSLDGPPFPAPYWVYGLGPATFNGTQYQWAIVSDPLKVGLFVLTRDVATFKAEYETEVLALLKELGFVWFWNKPRPTFQEGCVY